MRLDDPLLLAAVDDNVDAMIVAHGLSYLPRAEAFAILDDPAIAGLERWEDAEWGYSRESTPPELDPWLERIPQSHEYFLYRHGPETDIAIGGTGYEDFPPGAKYIVGYFITVVLADLTVRFRGRSKDPLKWRLVDPLPSLRCRSFFFAACSLDRNGKRDVPVPRRNGPVRSRSK